MEAFDWEKARLNVRLWLLADSLAHSE